MTEEYLTLERERMGREARQSMDHYKRTAEDLESFGLKTTLSDESAICGLEDDGTPTIFAEVTHPRWGVITQRPARELSAFAWGVQWATIMSEREEG
jgi:hypothetical protein